MIRPCPWCGGTSVSVEELEFRYRVAVCDECGAHAPDVRHNTLVADQLKAEQESSVKAIEAWNTRESI